MKKLLKNVFKELFKLIFDKIPPENVLVIYDIYLFKESYFWYLSVLN